MRQHRWKLIVFLLLGFSAFFFYSKTLRQSTQWKMADFISYDKESPLNQDQLSEVSLNASQADHGNLGKAFSSGFKIESQGENSLTQKMGFQVGDVIYSLNGSPVKSLSEVQKVLGDFLKGRAIYIEYLRAGEKKTFGAILL